MFNPCAKSVGMAVANRILAFNKSSMCGCSQNVVASAAVRVIRSVHNTQQKNVIVQVPKSDDEQQIVQDALPSDPSGYQRDDVSENGKKGTRCEVRWRPWRWCTQSGMTRRL